MEYHLPEMGAAAIPFPHFPTRQQAFIFQEESIDQPWQCLHCAVSLILGILPVCI